MTRSELLDLIHSRLKDRDWVTRLTATTDSGSKPVLPVLLTDHLRDVVSEVNAVGGSANLVVGLPNALAVVTIKGQHKIANVSNLAKPISSECTFADFLIQLQYDGGSAVYTIASTDENVSGEAQVLAA